MQEWVDETVKNILSLSPKKILEVGCGTGLLLSKIAPQSKEYCGVDFSFSALNYLNKILIPKQRNLNHVKLEKKSANQLSQLNIQKVDCVILNSIVQYFPNFDYLTEVISQAISKTNNGGFIFLGDIRDYSLLNTFHTSILLSQLDDDCSVSEFKNKLNLLTSVEKEFLLSPICFWWLQKHFKRIVHIDLLYKKGIHKNEMSAFRYNVILYLDMVNKINITNFIEYSSTNSLKKIEKKFAEDHCEVFKITNIPNARIMNDHAIAEKISANSDHISVLDIIKSHQTENVISANEFFVLAKQHNYETRFLYQAKNSTVYDVVFFKSHLKKINNIPVVFISNQDHTPAIN